MDGNKTNNKNAKKDSWKPMTVEEEEPEPNPLSSPPLFSSSESSTSSPSSSEESSTSSSSSSSSYASFVITALFCFFFVLLSYLVLGSAELFRCKVAQSNIMPTDLNYTPFSDKPSRVFTDATVNFNVIKVYDNFLSQLAGTPSAEYSTKVKFDYDHPFVLIKWLNRLSDVPFIGFFGLFLRDVFANTMAKLNLFMNLFYQKVNSTLPESWIIVLYPVIASLVTPVIGFASFCLTAFYNVWCLTDFFSKKKDYSIVFLPFRIWSYCMYLLFVCLPVLFIAPTFLTLYALFAPLFQTATSISSDKKNIGFVDFMRDTLLYKSQLYLVIMSIVLSIFGAMSLGPNAYFGFIVGTILLALLFNVYNPVNAAEDPFLSKGLASTLPAKLVTMVGGGRRRWRGLFSS